MNTSTSSREGGGGGRVRGGGVEICIGSLWRSACKDQWGEHESELVCRELQLGSMCTYVQTQYMALSPSFQFMVVLQETEQHCGASVLSSTAHSQMGLWMCVSPRSSVIHPCSQKLNAKNFPKQVSQPENMYGPSYFIQCPASMKVKQTPFHL